MNKNPEPNVAAGGSGFFFFFCAYKKKNEQVNELNYSQGAGTIAASHF
jgi:galactokinase/mevalonate kinase-like predicted kinase